MQKGNCPRVDRARLHLVLALALAAACGGQIQSDGVSDAKVQRAPVISHAEQYDQSGPLTLLPVPERRDTNVEHEVKRIPRPPAGAQLRDPVHQTSAPLLLVPTINNSFDGVGNGFSGPNGTFSVNAAPPDTNGDVGPRDYVQTVNTDFAIFNKDPSRGTVGTVRYGPVPINTLWSGFGGGCQTNNDGDPVVLYDPIADRWVISQFSVTTTPYLQCVAVSTTNDPTGSWNRYAFSYGNTAFPDYPKMGVWPDAYYITFNIFNNGSTYAGAKLCAYDRASMINGAPATQQCFPNTSTTYGGLLPADLDGARLPPSGSPNYIVGQGSLTTTLAYWKFHVDWTTPSNSSLTGPTEITVPSYVIACNNPTDNTCIPQSGTNQQLDALSDRLMFRLAYRNLGDHEALVTNHSVSTSGNTGPSGIRWYELRPDASHNLTVFQQGTYAPDSTYRWMGSIAMDQAGNIGLGFSASSSSIHPQIKFTGRLAGDVAGTMTQGEGSIIAGGGSQTTNLNRWGDYSMMAVDPSDDCTLWYTQEYIPANGTFNWKTRIANFKLSNCPPAPTNDFSISASPSSLTVNQGASGTSTISTTITSGSAQSVSLSTSGCPSGASCTFSPNPIQSGGSSTLTVGAGTATPGTYTITVTGTGTSATHSTTVTLTVPPNDFSISANPTSLTLNQNSTGTSAISTAVTSGNPQTVNLTVSGCPGGASCTVSPTSITSGNGSTLTINSGTAAGGTYTVTVTGAGTSNTHSTTVALTVNGPPPPNDFSISANPNSLTVNQGASGNSTISTTVTSGNPQSITLSTNGCPTGASCNFGTNPIQSGGSSTLTVGAGTAAPGTYTITVTGTGVSATHSTTVSLTVPANDFSISASPTSVNVTAGNSGTSTISTVLTSGNAQSITLSASGMPAGTTATFATNPINSGGSSLLTLATSATTPAGTYTITVTGAGASATHTTAVTLGVTAPSSGGMTNGGFETGNFTGWTTVGTAAVVSGGAHSGTYSARIGGTSPTNGDSSISQTFTVPTGQTLLSFWYQVHCPDTVTYDWATATLQDNTTNTTTTILARTCTNSGSWVSTSAGVTAGHSYTLTLISHDDNYPGDPTYTLYDDVALSSPPPNPIVNPGFETGNLTGWTTAGTTAVVSGGAHSGTYSARLGGTSPTSGDSSIKQTFTAPSGSSKLSFWYQVHCPDTVTYDWATATLQDNTTNTTTTILARTCTNSGSWVSTSAGVTAGHSYTLTLISHDDNYPGDPTYTLYDDVVVQ